MTLVEHTRDRRTPARSLRSFKITEPYETPNLVKELVETQPADEEEGGEGMLAETQAMWKLKATPTEAFR